MSFHIETKLARLVFVALTSACAGAPPAPALPCTSAGSAREPLAAPPAERPLTLTGQWTGGFALAANRTVPMFVVDFERRRARTDDPNAFAPVLHATERGEVVHFETVIGGSVHVFDGRRTAPDVLDGDVESDGVRGTFRVARTSSFDRDRFVREVEGTYKTAGGDTFLVSARASSGRLFDVGSGRTRALLPLEDGTYAVGPGFVTAFPRAGTLRLVRASGNTVGSIVLSLEGHDETAPRNDPIVENVRIDSGGTKLAGTVYVPEGAAPHPGVVFVHGSGRQTRDDWWQQAMTRVFLREGFAVLLYDKRGVGESEGEYVGPGAKDTNNVSPENLERLAGDARAAAAVLAARPDVDRTRVGLFGISQAGWIMPLAASRSKDVGFLVEVSGPTVTTFLEDVHSKVMLDGEKPSDLTLDDADEIVRWAPKDRGVDPAPALSRLRVPALFLFGALDSSIPVRECLRVLDRLKKGHDFEVVTFADAGHMLFTVPRDLEGELVRSPGFQKDELPAMRRWLKAHIVDRAPAAARR